MTAQRPAGSEARRRLAVRFIFFIYVLFLMEGALRKWFLPSFAGPLTLLRDPFVIVLYIYCVANGLISRTGPSRIWLGFAFFTSAFGVVQYAASGFSLAGWLLGVRTYWLYMPMAFVVARVFEPEDVRRFLRLNLWLAVPYAVLVSLQYRSPPFSPINWGIGGDESSSVGLTNDIFRPFGLFTYTGPNVFFTAAMVAMFMSYYLWSGHRRLHPMFLLVAGASVGTMSVLTGSRTIYFMVAFIVVCTIFVPLVARPTGQSFRRVFGILGFVILAALLFTQVFTDMFQAMNIRFDQAARFEGSIWNRASGDTFAFVDALATAPLIGHGIGAGAPGVASILGLPDLIYGEADTARNINELGVILGALFLILRGSTAVWLLATSFKMASRGITQAVPLGAFAAMQIAVAQITHSPLIAFMPWLAAGLMLALQSSRATS